jgi:hypothetical protein
MWDKYSELLPEGSVGELEYARRAFYSAITMYENARLKAAIAGDEESWLDSIYAEMEADTIAGLDGGANDL